MSRVRALASLGVVLLVTGLSGVRANASPALPTQSATGVPPTWLGLGDSFSSGEGLPDNSNRHPNDGPCERARADDTQASAAWGPLAAANDGRSFAVDFTACTGAITDDVLQQGGTGGVQIDEALNGAQLGSRRWGAVSFSYGGNNLSSGGLSKVIMDCIGLDARDSIANGGVGWGAAPWVGCSVGEDELLRRVDQVTDTDFSSVDLDAPLDCSRGHDAGSDDDQLEKGKLTLPELYQVVAECIVRADGVVVVMGYPQLVEESGRWDGGWTEGNRCQRIRRADVGRVRSTVARLNDGIRRVVERIDRQYSSHWSFVDPAQFFEGEHYGSGGASQTELDTDSKRHALCGKGTDWLNGIVAHSLEFHRSFHPKQSGHDAMAKGVEAQAGDELDRLLERLRTASPLDPTGSGVEPLPAGFTAVQAVVDVSGSMGDPADSSGQSKMAAAQLALGGILSALSAESGGAGGGTPTQAGLVTFDTFATVAVPMTSDVDQLRSGVSGLSPGDTTNIGAGLTEGLNQIEAAGQGGTLILLSDGLITEGMESGEILSQLVPRAQAMGVKIFTIGFGEAENLDESLLRQLADQTGGSYGQAETIVGIQGLFLQARHQSQGTVLASVTSAVGLGQTTTASAFTIPEGAAELHTALAWPGSDLDMALIDPKGNPVDANYHGARFVTDDVTEVVVVDAPEPGEWRMDVTGVEMSGATEDFFAIASTRGQVALVPPDPAIWPFLVGGGSLTLLAGGGATAALVASRRRNGQRRVVGPTLSVSVTAGISAGLTLLIHPGDVLGRDTDADVRLPDDSVSRRHCQFIVVEGAFAVVDLDSSSGTFRNGEAIQRARLSVGDVLDLGEARLLILESSDV